jgi:hypothetical protein
MSPSEIQQLRSELSSVHQELASLRAIVSTTLATLTKTLDAHEEEIYGCADTDGLRTRVDRLEQFRSTCKVVVGGCWAAIVAVVGSVTALFWGSSK